MYEAKFRKYITKNEARFAEPDEIKSVTVPLTDKSGNVRAGVPLYCEDGTLYVDNGDSHSLVIGPTGCKKTRVSVFSTVSSIIQARESAVINDPKGEIYNRTAKMARKHGADVFVLNFRNPSKSHYWSPLAQAYRYYKQGKTEEYQQCIDDFASVMVSATQEQTKDRYWGDAAELYIAGVLLSLIDSVPEEYFNLKNMIPFCYQKNADPISHVLDLMDDSSSAAFCLHSLLDLKAESTKSCVYSIMSSILRPLTKNESLLKMLSGNSFHMEDLGKKPTLVYVIYPDEKSNLNFLVNLFITQCYETLLSFAAENLGNRLPVRVNFVLDEFSNLARISNFENRISEARSKNIRYFLFIQSYAQLKDKYRECAETIISNCNNWICFSSKDMDFLDKIKQICGYEVDFNGKEHPLVSPYDMQYLQKRAESADVLVLKQGIHPYIATLPDIDFISQFKGCGYELFPIVDVPTNAKSMSVVEWSQKVHSGKFKVPFRNAA